MEHEQSLLILITSMIFKHFDLEKYSNVPNEYPLGNEICIGHLAQLMIDHPIGAHPVLV
jgi:hypothetical protein